MTRFEVVFLVLGTLVWHQMLFHNSVMRMMDIGLRFLSVALLICPLYLSPWNILVTQGGLLHGIYQARQVFQFSLAEKRGRRGKWIQIIGSIFLYLQFLCLNLIGISFWGFYWDIEVRQPILSDRHGHKLQRHVIALNGSQLQL